MGKHVLLKVKVGHLSTLSPFLLLFHFDLELGEVTPNLLWMLWQMYFYKINAQMVFIMFNDELLGLLMIIIEYLMILYILMTLIVLNSLHRGCVAC